LAFKASLVPFHLWTPDVYQGAPTVATAYMSAVAKVAAFGVLIRLTLSVAPALELWGTLLWWLSLLSMIVGNAVALLQRDAKRMLAYSSIAHAGYLTVGLVSANATGVAGMIYYLVAYSLMTVGAFAVLGLMARAGDATTVDALQGLYRRSPFAAHTMAILLLSLAGIPPTAGFWGKWYLFFAAVESEPVAAGRRVGADQCGVAQRTTCGWYSACTPSHARRRLHGVCLRPCPPRCWRACWG
jgi:NADH-quinone oxidoreductase subunit N